MVPPVCLLQKWGPCRGPLVDGHIVQQARQKLFAVKDHVLTFDDPPFRYSSEMRKRGKLVLPRRVHTGVSTTLQFSCKFHDRKVFAASESGDINIASLGQDIELALDVLAYKSACGHLAKTRKSAMAWSRLLNIWPDDPIVAQFEFYERHRLIKAMDIHALSELALTRMENLNMLHEVTETSKRPTVAAQGVYPVVNPVIAPSTENSIGVWTPKFVTAYPTRSGQLVITSWVQSPEVERPIIVRRIGDGHPEERHLNAILASVALVQDCETINLSPSAWQEIPKFKRDAIAGYYDACRPTIAHGITEAMRPPADWLNLFGTSPLRDC